MKAVLRLPRAATYAEYLAVERSSARRHELLDGVIVAMAGGSDEHNALAGRMAMVIGLRLPESCRYYSPDQRFWIAARVRSRYADGSVICGRPEHPPHDGQASTNPLIVIEVLSPSSAGDDEGDKREDFESLDALESYVILDQDRRRVRIYRRGEDRAFLRAPETIEHGACFRLSGLVGPPIEVDEIYRGILAADGRSLLR